MNESRTLTIARRTATVVLLAFVAVSLATLAVKWTRRSLAEDSGNGGDTTLEASEHQFIAYYFHTRRRCSTCNKIEAYSKEAIHNGFGEHLDDGRLQWRVVNFEEEGNRHYKKQYDLVAACLILVEMDHGEPRRWENLVEAWVKVDDKEDFTQYVQESVRAFMSEE